VRQSGTQRLNTEVQLKIINRLTAVGPAKITRREVTIGAGVLALAGVAAAGASYYWLRGFGQGLTTAAPAQGLEQPSDGPPLAELMKPSPLGEMVLGSEAAPCTIIEYASMTCPHCAHFSEATFPQLKTRYIDTGKVRFIFREFPLDQLAAAGFMLARCAGPEKYFPMIETLFARQREWVVQRPLEPLFALVQQAGFTKERFESCLTNQQVLEGIEKVRDQGANEFGVNSTPTFFINGKRFSGDLSIDEMSKQIEPYLKG
jgi:protein-disulfide isomerase